jgi:hypothetical protein
MRHLRFAAIALALFVAGTALAGAATHSPSAPTNLRAFLLRVNEPISHSYSRTPAFVWSPVHGARCYQFEVGTSKSFTENSLIWSNVSYVSGAHSGCPTVPAISIDTALPWFTGSPYALYAHVRAVTGSGATRWSAPFGFNVRWENVPKPMASQPGLVRWTPVDGATGYQVWYTDLDTPHVSTNTNVADEREFYTFHTDPSFTQTVHWRVRAVRQVFGRIPNGLPAVSYGPWSNVYTSTNPPVSASNLALRGAISDTISTAQHPAAHELMPALTFTGTSVGGRQYQLWRIYAATDRDCVNVVFTGAVFGGPAYAPRTSGPLKLPGSDTDLQLALTDFLPSAATESDNTFSADGGKVVTSEATSSGGASSSGTSSGSSSSSSSSSSGSSTASPSAKVDLPDLNFPTTRYYWTLVPVLLTEDESGAIQYHDTEIPQDACAAGRIGTFGKQSAPVVTTAGTPFLAGLSPNGRLLSSVEHKPVVYGTPLVAWQPAKAASAYQIQWSRKLYPWKPAGTKQTFSTSAVLRLAPGKWYYRVRGLNNGALGLPFMRWSTPVLVTVAKPTFRLIASR